MRAACSMQCTQYKSAQLYFVCCCGGVVVVFTITILKRNDRIDNNEHSFACNLEIWHSIFETTLGCICGASKMLACVCGKTG